MRALWFLALAACAPVGAVLPPGYPPQIGTVTATLNGKAEAWDTYDYSVGALDAAVQITAFNGVQFHLMGDPGGKPNGAANRLLIKGGMRSASALGALTDPVIEIIAGEAFDGARLTSIGAPVAVSLDSLTPMTAGGYGHVTGHFKATLCGATGQPAQINRAACQPFEGIFTSDLQISGS